jgi:hypothetical protein
MACPAAPLTHWGRGLPGNGPALRLPRAAAGCCASRQGLVYCAPKVWRGPGWRGPGCRCPGGAGGRGHVGGQVGSSAVRSLGPQPSALNVQRGTKHRRQMQREGRGGGGGRGRDGAAGAARRNKGARSLRRAPRHASRRPHSAGLGPKTGAAPESTARHQRRLAVGPHQSLRQYQRLPHRRRRSRRGRAGRASEELRQRAAHAAAAHVLERVDRRVHELRDVAPHGRPLVLAERVVRLRRHRQHRQAVAAA